MPDPYPRITEDDQTIRAALEEAHIPSLMVALVHLAGDAKLLRGDIKPEMSFLGDPQGGITPEQQEEVRALALDALRSYRDSGCQLPPPPTAETVREMLDFIVAQEVSDDYVEFLMTELSLQGEDPYGQPALLETTPEARAGFKVLIIGAGMSGLLAAVRLQEAGIPFVIVEKNDDVGGTWYENRYPGCRVDSPNHVYSYSFRQQDWPQHFSNRDALHQYFSSTADEYGLRPHIRFETEVQAARFDEQTGRWRVEVALPSGGTDVIEANAIISAVGQLNRPKIPDLPGLDTFGGPAFHSAEWEDQHDLAGKRIGVIGTGASAFQLVPQVAERAEQVTVFQRTAPWVIPNPEYTQYVPSGKHWLLNHVPFYARWFRFGMFWRTAEGLLGAVTGDPSWDKPEQSVSPMNEMLRGFLVMNLQEVVGHDPELLAKCTPNYPPGAKRALIDDGAWLRSLTRDNVSLITEPIQEVTARGVRTEDGVEYEFDVLVFATGFQASSFLHPIKIFGKGGAELHDLWDGEPRAYKGVTIPGFPNLFCCYGPNTNIVVNGSIIFFSECEVRYILGCIALLLVGERSWLDVKRDVHDAYNERIDEGNRAMAWGQSSVNTWYKNDSGRITQNWPFSLLEFWQQSREVDPADYELG